MLIKKNTFYYLLVLIIYLPFQKLFEAILGSNTHLSTGTIFWTSHWYELVSILLVLFFFIRTLLSRGCPATRLNRPALVFVLFAFFSALLLTPNLGQGLEGFRFAALAAVFLVLAQISRISERDRQVLISSYLVMAAILAIWAIVERFLPQSYWHILNISDFGWGKYEIFHKYYQSASFLDGPNQLASYLLPAIFIILFKIDQILNKSAIKSNRSVITGFSILLIVFCAVIVLTFSRSALLALAIALLIYSIFGRANKNLRIALTSAMVVAIVAGFVFFSRNQTEFNALVLHGGSQIEHRQAYVDSANEIKYRFNNNVDQFILGGGIGTAGPAVLKYGNGLISESWYLQLWLELGLIGVIIWFWLMADLFIKLLFQRQEGIAYALLAVSFTAIFLHTWADNPAMAISLFILIGSQITTHYHPRAGDSHDPGIY